MEEEQPRVTEWMKTICLILKRCILVFTEGYTSQLVIIDGLPNCSFRNQSKKRSKASLWSKDKDWSADAHMKSSDTSED